jgi:Ca2+-binding EF-hand superfamily protein
MELPMGAEEEELKTKIRQLVTEKFDGNYRKGFEHYDKIDGEDSKIGSSALEKLLADADVGNWLTRGLWVDAVMKALDKDKDGAISWDEFESTLEDSPQTKADQDRGQKLIHPPDT